MTLSDFHGIKAKSAIDALAIAAGAGMIKQMQLLLADGTDINGVASFPQVTPLASAAGDGVIKSVEFLLKNGADINNPGPNHKTPLMHACSCGGKKGSQVAAALIKAGADIACVRSSDEMTALKFAVGNSTPELIQMLIDHGADVDGPPGTDQTALMLAARADDVEALKVLVRNGADTSRPCKLPWAKNRTALGLAGLEKCKKAVKFLTSLDSDAPVVSEQAPILTPDNPLFPLLPWIKRQERPCWLPMVEDGDGDVMTSKFGGIPWLDVNESWPTCKACHLPLELFLQLNLAELPAELNSRFGTGLLQFFYCTEQGEECEGENGWEPFSDSVSRVRIVSPHGMAAQIPCQNRCDAKRIIEWEKTVDYPSPAEHDQLGIIIDYHFNDVPFKPTEITCKELGLHFTGIEFVDSLGEIVQSLPGDKLAGWPCWVQGVEYPHCPKCGERMELLFQIGSEDHIPFMFGDCGIGHITQCRQHKEVVAFGWACS
ncbi:ankyrin repeat domain-containing protein [Schlesneria paludicola]|uniref:ankyrin repeat domain-containing protein n=1 Tax=Schlesneria paludicola TaxID=360056 RepID=UPI00029A78E4|nr:ankyrin repeat domain-containing protein [Schlesneria paludicola]